MMIHPYWLNTFLKQRKFSTLVLVQSYRFTSISTEGALRKRGSGVAQVPSSGRPLQNSVTESVEGVMDAPFAGRVVAGENRDVDHEFFI